MNLKIFLCCCLLYWISCCLSLPLFAQDYPPKREFRGVWVATVANIDWPSSQGLTSEEQQEEFKELVAFHKQNGMNALIVQVRPNADALYESAYEPWSRWLTGKEGKAPDPFYDPLEFMIKECRSQQMELHAWVNPFRAVFGGDTTALDSSHVFFGHPEWIRFYGKHGYLDPGVPQARDFSLAVIMDVVNRYDIDGLHFDDYFYPYKVDTLAFPDSVSFAAHGGEFENIDDWRRQNINTFIQAIHDSIEAVKPAVKFGVSPFGVWRNQSVDPLGSDSQAGQTTYDDLYADVRLWLQNGWIDYVVPQIYFSIGYPPADYEKLLDWWGRNTYGKQLYIGQAAYKVDNNHDERWKDASQIPRQIRMNRRNFQVDGSIYFSAKSFLQNPLKLNDSLRAEYYSHPALIPPMSWNHSPQKAAPAPPQQVIAARNGKDVLLQWEGNIHQEVRYYVVYLQKGDEVPNLSNAKAIIGTSYYPQLHFKEKGSGLFRQKHTIVVTAVDSDMRESFASEPVQIRLFPE
jgi:uncharacterized lipoprotein YddW (UPF0748 family)